ncbi:MarR family transcriptional regulator [Pseudonocardia hierapolitana]|uniref:MarR family transcriptional regulator n=1 Tax=Pseudonocardia hierapolitana TaxID=1128676 RepID=UPI0014788601|nr:MarR family transcriptional regulator [Pseudonocardia hierapolitana]
MAEYSVLALLYAADPKGMRMSDLARRRLMSTGGFTRLADRLVSRGLIERRRSPVDARSFDAILTSEGRALMQGTAPAPQRSARALLQPARR